MASKKISLQVSVVHAKGTGKAKRVTHVIFKFGPLTLGSTVLSGEWTAAQALSEVRKTRKVKLTTDGEHYPHLIFESKYDPPRDPGLRSA